MVRMFQSSCVRWGLRVSNWLTPTPSPLKGQCFKTFDAILFLYVPVSPRFNFVTQCSINDLSMRISPRIKKKFKMMEKVRLVMNIEFDL
jgi:hypothetical protein